MTRTHDIATLRALLADANRLKDGEQDAFAGMLERLDPDAARSTRRLTDAQRAWVTDAADRLELDDPADDPALRNRDVPRGRDVPVPAALQNLPKAPPGRRVKA